MAHETMGAHYEDDSALNVCHIGASQDQVMTGNSVHWELDARCKSRTVDAEPNGRAFVNIENSKNLMLANNVFHTVQSQSVVRLHNVGNSAVVDNIITFGRGGNAVAQTGNCSSNYYRPIDPKHSAPFDAYKR